MFAPLILTVTGRRPQKHRLTNVMTKVGVVDENLLFESLGGSLYCLGSNFHGELGVLGSFRSAECVVCNSGDCATLCKGCTNLVFGSTQRVRGCLGSWPRSVKLQAIESLVGVAQSSESAHFGTRFKAFGWFRFGAHGFGLGSPFSQPVVRELACCRP